MTPLIDDGDFVLHVGDALETLRGMPSESVHCCVTSPPYWGLRDYGTGSWEGGDEGCDHDARQRRRNEGSQPGTGNAGVVLRDGVPPNVCKCGARRVDNQLGIEPTPEEYVANMVNVFREVRRVLRRDGTCWLNIGDSYASGGGAGNQGENGQMASRSVSSARITRPRGGLQGGTATVDVSLGGGRGDGLKPKDLVGIPWRLAFALQADGWYLRSEIIWAKPNPMPESVTDRPTKSHEQVFLLTKSARYFYAADEIAEPARWYGPNGQPKSGPHSGQMRGRAAATWEERKAAGATAGNIGVSDTYQGGVHGEGLSHELGNGLTRNARSVWTIQTQQYADAHFAVFPEELPRRCILAGCPEDGTVLDPFGGSGTTALVARKLGRRSVLIELSDEYGVLIAKRLQQLSLLANA